MKTSQDPRHQKRITLMQKLFSYSFQSQNPDADLAPILDVLPTVDQQIAQAAPEWPIPKLAKIDLSILRLSVFELLITKAEPPKVIIDEAVELGKSFGNTSSAKFINGVLGTIMKGVTP
jgi:N utilization substance protein B